MINPIDTKEIPTIKDTCIQTFEFTADAPECGKPATFLVKHIYEPTYSIMCDECKRDFFESIAFQTVVKDYSSYYYTPELNKKFAEELEQYLFNHVSPEAEG